MRTESRFCFGNTSSGRLFCCFPRLSFAYILIVMTLHAGSNFRPRTRNGQSPQNTTGVANNNSIQTRTFCETAPCQWVAGNHVAHGQNKNRQRKDQADPESAAHVGQFGVFFLLTRLTLWFQGHAAFGATAGPVLQNFRVHGTGPLCAGRSRRSFSLQSHAAFRAAARPGLLHFRVHGTGVEISLFSGSMDFRFIFIRMRCLIIVMMPALLAHVLFSLHGDFIDHSSVSPKRI